MRFILPVLGIVLSASHMSQAQQGYGFLKLGKTQPPTPDYHSTPSSIIGFGSRFQHHSVEFAYLGFDNIAINGNDSSYIELKGSRVGLNGHLDMGWPELTLSLSAIYYDATAYHANISIGTEYDTSYGLGAGLLFPLTQEFAFTMNADLTKDILGQDLKHFSLGIQKDFN